LNVTNPNPIAKDRRLGKGLAALLGTPIEDEASGAEETTATMQRVASKQAAPAGTPGDRAAAPAGQPREMTAKQFAASHGESDATTLLLNVDLIDPNPFQPRRDFNAEEIASLAESLKRHEQLQPVLVRRVGDRYQLISGERRLRATIHAGRSTVRAEVRLADDRLVAELAIVENMERKDLNPVEKAMSFKRYIDQHQCKQEVLASRLGLDRSTVANLMRLLELPQQILDWIVGGELTAGHARALLPLGDEDVQLRLARQIQDEGWSVRKTETDISEMLRSEHDAETGAAIGNKARQKRTVTPHIDSLQSELRLQLGTKVEIRQTSKGKGKITIHFTSADEFDRIRAILADQSTPQLRIAG
jgi:ParB family transcriptional regulator, chromosome partitioning protein